MTDFIPPYPKRHKKNLGPINLVKYARRDLLSIWTEDAFDRQFMSMKIINRSIFIANHPDVIRHILVTNHGNYEKKNPLMRKALAPLLGDGLFISDGAVWQKHRELEEPMFNAEQVARYSEVMIKAVEERARQWAAYQSGSLISVLPEMVQLAAEIICRILFGTQISAEQIGQLIADFTDYYQVTEQTDFNAFFGLPSWMPGKKSGKVSQATQTIHAIFDKIIAENEKTGDTDTLLAKFLKLQSHTETASTLTREQIRHEIIVLFMVGYETTANTLAWAWYLISQCPEVEQRLHEEVDSVLGNRSASFTDVANLTYTRAIIEETMRLYPPIPVLSREAAAADMIRKRHVPAGSMMMIVPWLLHRHKQYWQNPDHFIPERFLDEKPNNFTYIPFSIGPRECIGKYFGTVEATLCLAILARRFNLRNPDGQEVSHECRLTLRPKGELPMHIIAR